MASYQDNVAFFNTSTTKLPSIVTNFSGRNSATQHDADVYQWMAPLRRQLDHSISYRGQPRAEDIDQLSKELIKFMIYVLQSQVEKQKWLDLNAILTLVRPYSFFMKPAPFVHYVERLCAFFSSNAEKLYDIPILDTLKNVFPECVSSFYEGGGPRWLSKAEKKSVHAVPGAASNRIETDSSFFGGSNPYLIPKHIEDPGKQFKSKRLTLSAIDKSIGSVTIEKAQLERVRKSGLSAVGAAANIDFPGMFPDVLEEETSSIAESEIFNVKPEEIEKEKVEFKSMSGREAVELFLNHRHLHKVKFIYFNVAENVHFRPYDLVSVPRDEIEKEHYIFSSFGVLHIYPDGDQSETLTLAEWNKAAVIWNAMRKIAFFKDYLIKKMFYRWRANVKWLTYLRTRKTVFTSLLHAIPEFGSALLHIFRLIQELSDVQFFPERPSSTFQFSITDFASSSQKIKGEAKDVLELFFCYSKKVVDATRETCLEQLKFYEEQVRQTKPLYLKESMYLQRMKKKLRSENLRKAREMMVRQNQLISLIDQVIAVHLLGLARSSITKFVDNVLCSYAEGDDHLKGDGVLSRSGIDKKESVQSPGAEPKEDGAVLPEYRPLFAAKFVFNKETCHLEMQPSVTKLFTPISLLREEFRKCIGDSQRDLWLEKVVNHCSNQPKYAKILTEAYSMHVQEEPTKSESPDRPSTAPASANYTDAPSYENTVAPSTSSSEPSASSLGFNDPDERQDTATPSATNFSTPNATPRNSKRPEQAAGLTNPDLTPRSMQEHEKTGKATPNMLLSTGTKDVLGMMVGGNRINLQYNPLDKKKLTEIFLDDEDISEALTKKQAYLETAVNEVLAFCEGQNQWLPEIRRFCSSWNEATAESYRGSPANEVELSINKIKDWIAQVQNMPRHFFTSNKLLYVDGRNPHNILVPVLNAIFKKLVSTIILEAKQISTNITSEVNDTLKVLKNKDTSMTSFAAYASKVNESIKKKEKMTQKVTYTRSIFDVVKMSARQLTPEEEKLYNLAKSSWEAFIYQLKDASNFVANQRPIIMKRLNEMFKELHDAAMDVCLRGSCHPVTDPMADPTQVLEVIQESITEFQDLRGKIAEVNYFHDAICNEFYSIDDLKLLGEALYDKQELWQLINTTRNTIHEWKMSTFRKFNPANAMSKIEEWLEKAEELGNKLGFDYPVLAIWQENIEDLRRQMPLLLMLSRGAIKTRHWKEIFAGMGESYEATWTLLVDDLLSLNLFGHAPLINRVYQDATSEYSVEKILTSIKKDWDGRQFDLAKHIYAVKISGGGQLGPVQVRRDIRVHSAGLLKQQTMQEKDSNTYVLVGVEKLMRDLTESHVTLQAMFQSRHAFEAKSDAEIWSDSLSQIEEIIHVWVTCQEKWMYLNRIFNGDPNIVARFPDQFKLFEIVDLKYREFIDSMLKDSKVLSVLSRRHGQKGWRELQGDVLRKHLLSCVKLEDEILLEIEDLLSDFRSQFPRLYFISDDDCVRLLGISSHPRALVPFVRKCFSGARSLVFSLPQSVKSGLQKSSSTNSRLDIELHSARLEATHVIGMNDECVEIDALPASNDVTLWMATLEKRIKYSLVKELQDCVSSRMKQNALSVADAFSEICETGQTDNSNGATVQQYSHWLLKYTLQTILLSDSVLWFRELRKYLRKGKPKEMFEDLKKQAIHKLKQFGQGISENSPAVAQSTTRLRLQCVLSALVTQAAYHRDMLRSLSHQSITINSFEWQKLIKHTTQIVDYSKAQVDVEVNNSRNVKPGELLDRSASVGHCYVEQFDYREEYGYEYTAPPGANNRGLCVGTVYTPLAERCMIDMWLSLRQGQCAGLFGPNGVGKSATLSELARIFGRLYINLNCSENASIESLKRSLCGMVESGAWLCFDQTQRLPADTLSMLSQHIKHIQSMYKMILCAANTQYTVRGYDESSRLKRSNSSTTLHGSLKDGSPTTSQLKVKQSYLNSLQSTRFEDYDAANYSTCQKHGSRPVGSITFDNQLLRCRKGFAVFMSFTNDAGTHPEIADCLRLIYRPTCVAKPDRQKLIEVWLLAAGFTDAYSLAMKLDQMYDVINKSNDHITADLATNSTRVIPTKLAMLDLRTLKSIIMVASMISNKKKSLRSRIGSVSSAVSETSSQMSSSRFSRRSEAALHCHQEELAIVDAILNIFPLRLANSDAVSRLKECLRSIFPLSARPLLPGDKDNKLAVAVQQQIASEGFQHTPELVDQVCQLHAMLLLNQSVVIAGPAGSGKTTLYRLLSKALNALCNETTMSHIINEEQESVIREQPEEEGVQASDLAENEPNPLTGVSTLSDIFGSADKTTAGNIKSEEAYSRTDVTVLYPNAYNLTELFGSGLAKSKTPGILVKFLKDCMLDHEPEIKQDIVERKVTPVPSSGRQQSSANTPKNFLSVKKWLVLDGEILSSWLDNLSCLLDDHKKTSTGRNEDIQLRPNTSIVFESADFSSASPAIASRCAIVHCNAPNQWHHIAKAWLDNAYGEYAVKQNCVEIWKALIADVVPKTLQFLSQRRSSVLRSGTSHYEQEKAFSCPGVHEITSFLAIFSSCLQYLSLSRSDMREKLETLQLAEKRRTNIAAKMGVPSAQSTSTTTQSGSVRSRMESVPSLNFEKSMNIFGFAFVWAFGGSLLENDMQAFDAFIKDAFFKSRYDVVKFPKYETVFDYFIDDESGHFTLWEDKIDLRPRPTGNGGLAYTPIHQFERYFFLSQCLLAGNQSLMLVGEQGCGKTSLIKNLVQPDFDLMTISVSPGLSSSQFQRMIEAKASPAIRQHNLGLMAHPSAIIASRTVERRSALFFLDDLSCAESVQSSEKTNCPQNQPLLELLRQVLSLHGVYESERLLFKSLEDDIGFLATCTLPRQCGAGLGHMRHTLSPRLTRHFTVVNFQKPTKESILSIYHHSVQSWLEEFPTYALTRHYELSQAIIAGSYDLYVTALSHFKPTPRHPHYVFSLHDISKVIEGMFLLKPVTRGRPIPLRHRGANELFKRPRMAGAHVGGRFRQALHSEDGDGEVLPMMKTIVRLWLHECCRVFQDKLSCLSDKHWLAKALQEALRKHFCTGPKDRMRSPPPPHSGKSRHVKTPIPSTGSTPMPLSSSSMSESGNEPGVEDGETIDNLQSDFEYETTSTQGTEYIIDEDTTDGSSSGPRASVTPSQPDQNVGGEFSTGDKSSESLGSAHRSFKSRATQSASSTISKDGATTVVTSSSSGKASYSQSDDVMSEATTNVVQDTDGDDSQAMTNGTGDDDAQSAVTGYTTEVESIFETEASLNETTETSGTESATTTPTSGSKSGKSRTPLPIVTVMQPSSGKVESDIEVVEKRGRPSFGRSKVSRPGGAKFGVTFVPGLVEQEATGQSAGPLVPYDQILGINESPSSIIFCQAILSSPNLPDRSGDTYCESFEIDLARGLKTCLEMFNSSVSSHMDRIELAFFGQAIRHAARLSRALCLKRGHAFLMTSSPFKGRHSLTRLVALFNNAKIFLASAENQNSKNQRSHLRKVIKDACYQAGVDDRKAVLLVDDDMSKDPRCMDDVCSLMREGQCPSLYTHDELADVAATLTPPANSSAPSSDTSILLKKKSVHDGSIQDAQETAQEKLDRTLEFYFSRVLSNLHVVVMAHVPVLEGPHDLSPLRETKCSDLYFHKKEELKLFYRFLRRCPDLMTRFPCVDRYGDWLHSSWRTLAQQYIEDSIDLGVDDMPWPHSSSRLEQVQYISHLMAHIHTDAISRTRASLQNGADNMISPMALRQMVQIFVGIAMDIKYEEHVNIQRLNGALGKVVESEMTLDSFKDERSQVIPKLHEARNLEQSWKTTIEQQRQEYSEARERCFQEEEVIKNLDTKVEDLKERTEIAFGKQHPMYEVAVAAQDALSPSWIDEVKRYKTPPPSAVEVILCLCEMFKVSPASWENGKALISRDNFYDEMVFYDKDNMPEELFLKLEARVNKGKFAPHVIEKGSLAASRLCLWIHAVYHYAKKARDLLPDMTALSKAEKNLAKAQAILGSKRVRCIEIKENLDDQIIKYKQASSAAKQYEKALKQLNTQVEWATFLRETIREHSEKWQLQLNESHARLDCAVGDAIVVAACVTYFGQFVTEQKEQALKHWIQAAIYGYIDQETGSFQIDFAKLKSEAGARKSADESEASIDPSSSVYSISSNPSIEEDNGGSSDSSYMDHNHYFVKVRDHLFPLNFLLSSDETRAWYKSNLPRDSESRFTGTQLYAMVVFQNCSWIFLFDPDNEARLWISASFKKMRETLILMETEKIHVDDDSSSIIQSEQVEVLDDDDDESVQASELGSETGTQVTFRVRLSATEKHVSRHTYPGEMRTSPLARLSPRDSPLSSPLNTPRDSPLKTPRNSPLKTPRNSPPKTPHEKVETMEEQQETPPPTEELSEEISPPMYPLDQLWVCSANDERFAKVLDSAITHGAFLLVTNVELAIPSNSAILQNIHAIRTFAARSKGVHFCFRLFLSTAVSINWAFQQSAPIFSVPIRHFSITNLALTEKCLEEKLEVTVLAQERPEFETQRRLMEADRFHLEQQLEHLQLDLAETVGAVRGNILDSPSIIDILKTCKEGVVLTEASLREVKEMEANLLQKKNDLVHVSQHGLMLYKSVASTSIIDPLLYHLTASQYIVMFHDCLKSTKRTKSKAAAALHGEALLKSRVVELKHCLTELLLKYVNRKYFQSDISAFSTLVSLNILVTSRKLTRSAMDEFLATHDVHGNQQIDVEDIGDIQKPSWMNELTWSKVLSLEQRYDCYPGLCRSISVKAKRWSEYFTSPPMLLSKVPSTRLYELTVGQKALLWKTVQPKKFNQIVADLNASVLGGFSNAIYSFDIDSMLCEIPPHIPCVLMLPSSLSGSCFLPLHHLVSAAKTLGLHYVEKSALFQHNLADVLSDCMIGGKWLILDDCHLVKRWSETFIQLLTSFINEEEADEPDPSAGKTDVEVTGSKSSSSIGSKEMNEKSLKPGGTQTRLHPDFRLWMVMKKSESNITLLPIILMQRAEFIALETPVSHKELVRKTNHTLIEASRMFRTTPVFFQSKSGPSYLNRVSIPYHIQAPFYNKSHVFKQKKMLALKLSLLFSALLERASFGRAAFSSPCFWSDGEALDAIKNMSLINRPRFAEDLSAQILSRQLLDARDAAIVRELIKLSFAPYVNVEKSRNIFAEILRNCEAGETIDHVFNSLLQKPDTTKLGLVSSSATELAGSLSALTDSLNDIRVFKATQRGKPIAMTDNFLLVCTREAALKRKLEFFNLVMDGAREAKLNFGILSVVMLEFYTGEVERLNTLIDMMRTDVKLCLAVVNSEAELTEDVHSMLECFARDTLARTWLRSRSNLFKFHASYTLSKFINFINDRVDLLSKYMESSVCARDNKSSEEFGQQSKRDLFSRKSSDLRRSSMLLQAVVPYNLAVFTRPDMFLRSILMAVARSHQQDAYRYTFEMEFISDFNRDEPQHISGAFETIFIDKLRLHKAVYDLRGEALHYSIAPTPQPLPWLQLKTIKKPRRPNDDRLVSTYPCPIWVNEQKMPGVCAEDDIIMSVPIATEAPVDEWLMKGVSITCYMGED